jgi:hypothetical protein
MEVAVVVDHPAVFIGLNSIKLRNS